MRIQSLLLRTQAYHFELVRSPGKEFYLSDVLSRASFSDMVAWTNSSLTVWRIYLFHRHRLSQIRTVTEIDETPCCCVDRTAGREPNVPSQQLWFHAPAVAMTWPSKTTRSFAVIVSLFASLYKIIWREKYTQHLCIKPICTAPDTHLLACHFVRYIAACWTVPDVPMTLSNKALDLSFCTRYHTELGKRLAPNLPSTRSHVSCHLRLPKQLHRGWLSARLICSNRRKQPKHRLVRYGILDTVISDSGS